MGRSLEEWEQEQSEKDWQENGWWRFILIGLIVGFILRGCV